MIYAPGEDADQPAHPHSLIGPLGALFVAKAQSFFMRTAKTDQTALWRRWSLSLLYTEVILYVLLCYSPFTSVHRRCIHFLLILYLFLLWHSGIFHSSKSDDYMFHLRGVWCIAFLLFLIEIPVCKHWRSWSASDLCLHCLPRHEKTCLRGTTQTGLLSFRD